MKELISLSKCTGKAFAQGKDVVAEVAMGSYPTCPKGRLDAHPLSASPTQEGTFFFLFIIFFIFSDIIIFLF